ncbi:MAG TPA: hypothetical protein VFR23_04135 [Jiangellaceae bacterium]|nr:hypothetical protein [Jiangellaceae bacterium]
MTPKAVKEQLRARASNGGEDGEWCEMQLTGCLGLGVDPSHRIGQKSGGRNGAAYVKNNRLSNLVWACRMCHDWCHERRAEAREFGLILDEGDDPPAEPLVYRGVLSYLTDDGRVLDYFEEAA